MPFLTEIDRLPEDLLLKFLQHLSPEDLNSFCSSNEKISEICFKDSILKSNLITAFANKIIKKYSPLLFVYKTFQYASTVEYHLKMLVQILEMGFVEQNEFHEKCMDFTCVLFGMKRHCFSNLEKNEHVLKKCSKIEKEILVWVRTHC